MDSQYLVSGSYYTIQLIDVQNLNVIHTFSGVHTGNIYIYIYTHIYIIFVGLCITSWYNPIIILIYIKYRLGGERGIFNGWEIYC